MTSAANFFGARRHLPVILATVILAAVGTTGCRNAEKAAAAPADVDMQGIAEEAFIYGYPIVMNYGVMYESNIDEKSSQFRGGMNKLVNIARVFTPADTSVVTPNSDTPYSMLQLDLRAEPMVICVPRIPKERYYSVQLVDMYSFNYGYIGSRATGNDAGCFMVAGPDWAGQAPAGIKKTFKSETQFSLTIFRTQLFNAADIDNVKAVQAGYSAVPLSTFTRTAAPAASRHAARGRRGRNPCEIRRDRAGTRQALRHRGDAGTAKTRHRRRHEVRAAENRGGQGRYRQQRQRLERCPHRKQPLGNRRQLAAARRHRQRRDLCQ
jgi:hypothetical protein